MENAARALTMAAGVLIGIMIISIAVYLFTSLGNTSSEIYSKVEQTKIDKFNSQFLKYYRLDTCTAHDIVSIANLAKNRVCEGHVLAAWRLARNDCAGVDQFGFSLRYRPLLGPF